MVEKIFPFKNESLLNRVLRVAAALTFVQQTVGVPICQTEEQAAGVLENQCPDLFSSSGWNEYANCLDREKVKVIAISHGGKSDAFWHVVEDAVLRAGRDMRINAIYRTTDSFDLVGMAELIREATEEMPQGLLVSNPESSDCLGKGADGADCSGLHEAIAGAIKIGIPVMMMNAGGDTFQAMGVQHFVGQDEFTAGYKACEKIKAGGASKIAFSTTNREVIPQLTHVWRDAKSTWERQM